MQNINLPYEAISCKDVNCKIFNAMLVIMYKYVNIASKCRPG